MVLVVGMEVSYLNQVLEMEVEDKVLVVGIVVEDMVLAADKEVGV